MEFPPLCGSGPISGWQREICCCPSTLLCFSLYEDLNPFSFIFKRSRESRLSTKLCSSGASCSSIAWYRQSSQPNSLTGRHKWFPQSSCCFFTLCTSTTYTHTHMHPHTHTHTNLIKWHHSVRVRDHRALQATPSSSCGGLVGVF